MAFHARRPVGWRNEGYRHYLAAKGIPTRRYMQLRSPATIARYRDLQFDYEKPGSGNRRPGGVKALYKQRWTNETIRQKLLEDPNAFARQGVTLSDVAPIPRYKKKYGRAPTPEEFGVEPVPLVADEGLMPTTPVPSESLGLSSVPAEPPVSVVSQESPPMRPLPPGVLPEGLEPLDESFDEPPPSREKLNRMTIMSPGVPEVKSEFDRLE